MKKIMIALVLAGMSAGAYAAEFSGLQTFKAEDVKSLTMALPVPAVSETEYDNDAGKYPGIGLITNDAIGQKVYSHTFGDKLAILPRATAIWTWFADAACAAGARYKIEVENFSGYKNLKVSYTIMGATYKETLTPGSTVAYLTSGTGIGTLYLDACNGGINNGRNPIVKIGVFSTTCSEKYAFRGQLSRDKWGDATMDSAMAIATITKKP